MASPTPTSASRYPAGTARSDHAPRRWFRVRIHAAVPANPRYSTPCHRVSPPPARSPWLHPSRYSPSTSSNEHHPVTRSSRLLARRSSATRCRGVVRRRWAAVSLVAAGRCRAAARWAPACSFHRSRALAETRSAPSAHHTRACSATRRTRPAHLTSPPRAACRDRVARPCPARVTPAVAAWVGWVAPGSAAPTRVIPARAARPDREATCGRRSCRPTACPSDAATAARPARSRISSPPSPVAAVTGSSPGA